jgi:N-acetylglutamate synthase-like GNAT family acetyltransferase
MRGAPDRRDLEIWLWNECLLMTAVNLPSYLVRPTRVEDVEALGQFIRPFVEQGRLLPRTHDELQELTENGFVAISDERIVGFAALEIYSPKLAELRSLAVSTECQGQGIGKALVNACLRLAEERHVFEVMTITSSEDFFHKCGFEFTLPGERKALFHQTREQY